MSTREQRGYQMFPVLDGARVETALRFASGPERHFAPGEMLYDHGQQGAPAWLVLSGSVDITRRDGLDREAPVVLAVFRWDLARYRRVSGPTMR
jgi:thioredoxin reductase (NADPH)